MDQVLLDKLLQLPPDQLAKVDHATLYMARERAARKDQDQLAGAEHRAFAREATTENPLLGLPIALASLAYQPYKAIQGGSRSNPSLDQAMQGIVGVGEGLGAYATQKMQAVSNIFQEMQPKPDVKAEGDNPSKKT